MKHTLSMAFLPTPIRHAKTNRIDLIETSPGVYFLLFTKIDAKTAQPVSYLKNLPLFN